MANTPLRNIRIEDDLWLAAKVEADKRGETVTVAIRRFLTAYKAGAAVLVAVLATLTGSASAEPLDPHGVELCQAHLGFNVAVGFGSRTAVIHEYSAAFHKLTDPVLIAAETDRDGSQDVRERCLAYGVDIAWDHYG